MRKKLVRDAEYVLVRTGTPRNLCIIRRQETVGRTIGLRWNLLSSEPMRKKSPFSYQHLKAANRHLKGVLIFRTARIFAQGGASAVVQAETCA